MVLHDDTCIKIPVYASSEKSHYAIQRGIVISYVAPWHKVVFRSRKRNASVQQTGHLEPRVTLHSHYANHSRDAFTLLSRDGTSQHIHRTPDDD